MAGSHPERARAYADRAIELLVRRTQFLNFDWSEVFHRELLTTWWIHPLRRHPEFGQFLGQMHWKYGLATRSSAELESRELHGLDPAAHLAACRTLAEQGWRIVSLDAGQPPGAAHPGAASVWHRPVVSQRQQDQLAQRQTSAAVALSRLGRPDTLWPLLTLSPDPRRRTDLIHRLGPTGSEPLVLAGRVVGGSDSGV